MRNATFILSRSAKMGLVDYGSDSEEESIPAVKVTPLASTKRAKGPVRILLDLPKPTASPAIQEPPQKRAKFTPSLSGTSALSQMLPAPKHESVATKLQKSLAQPSINHPFPLSTSSTTSNNALVPHTIQKSQKAAQQQAATDFFGLGQRPLPLSYPLTHPIPIQAQSQPRHLPSRP